MCPTQLFIMSLALCTASASGQAQSIGNSAARSAKANAVSVSAADQLRAGSADESEVSKAPADDPVKAQSASRKQLIKLLDAQRNAPRFIPGSDIRSDTTCFFIRSYLMVRDDPHSDSTHRDGSTTCVPSARFRVYTADERLETNPPRLSQP
jgi:hypothetical protein